MIDGSSVSKKHKAEWCRAVQGGAGQCRVVQGHAELRRGLSMAETNRGGQGGGGGGPLSVNGQLKSV